MALNVLVVDDSRIMRSMVKRVLDLSGLPITQVCEAGSGVEALTVLAGTAIDLALVDINMPHMNGVQLLGRIRTDDRVKELPVVVVSTEGSDERIREVAGLGASFVRKPFSPETLVDAVIDAIGGSYGELDFNASDCNGTDF
jgi:two-component system chemotaxis response regulator CheY